MELEESQRFSLKQFVRQRFIQVLQSAIVKSSTKEVVMILDNYSVSLMSNLFNLSQLVGLGVTMIEKLQVVRKPLAMHAFYFIEPKETSIKYLLDDFKEQQGIYSRIHILFPYKCPKDILQQLSLSAKIMKKIRSIKQFYHTLFFLNENIVTMKQDYLQVAYSDMNSNREKKIRGRISDKFIEIFRNLSFYQVNLYYKKSISGIAERMAETISEDFKEFIKTLRMEKSSILSENAENVEVLLIDRSIDPVTPLLHDFFYESMLFDLENLQLVYFPTKEQKQKEKENNSQILPKGLNQLQDQAYQRYRYKHIADILESLPRDIVQLSKKVKEATSENIMDIDINISKKYQMHMRLVRQCQKSFQDKQLAEIGEIEQSLATGIDINGAQTSSVKLIQNIKESMAVDYITEIDKIRLALIAYCCISFSEKDYKKLTKLIPQEYHKVFVNFVWLGISLSMDTKRSTKNIKDNIRKIALDKLNRHNMNLSRYSSIVELILPIISEGLYNNITIDEDIFGSLVINQNEKKVVQIPMNKQTRKREKIVVREEKTKRTMIILFVGGASYAEVRAIKNLGIEDKFNLIIAADSFITAEEYIEEIRNMKSPN